MLPTTQMLNEFLDSAITALIEETGIIYRPAAEYNQPGGFLDFRALKTLPLIIVPDLHARTDFFRTLLRFKLPERYAAEPLSISELLARGHIRIVCVGDGLHSEARARDRWTRAFEAYLRGIVDSKAMREEMTESLSLMMMVMQYKARYPAHFHFLKGNHENILNENVRGNHPFGKFVYEGMMVYDFMKKVYGANLLHKYAAFEHLLPVCAAFPRCLISHAEPLRSYSEEELINALCCSEAAEGLTWTADGEAAVGSARTMLSRLLENPKGAHYFGGHRSITGSYQLRDDGHYVQLHNPDMWNIAVIPHDREIDLEKDIFSVNSSQRQE